MGRKGKKKWIAVVTIALLLFLFRKALLIGAVKVALSIFLSGKSTSFIYEKIDWENDQIRIEEAVLITSDVAIHIDQIQLAFSGPLWALNAGATLFHPEVQIRPGLDSRGAVLQWMLPARFLNFSWEIYDGVLCTESLPPLYFTFQSQQEENQLGKVIFSYQPQIEAYPLLACQIEKNQQAFDLHFSLTEEQLPRFLSHLHILYPHMMQEWQAAQGKIAVAGKLSLDEKLELKTLSCNWKIDQLALSIPHEEIAFCAEHLSGDIFTELKAPLKQLWKEVKGEVFAREAELTLAYLSQTAKIRFEEGLVVIDPDKEPLFALKGSWQQAQQQFPFDIHITSPLQSDTSLSLALQAEIGNIEEHSLQARAEITLVHTEDAFETRAQIHLGEETTHFFARFPSTAKTLLDLFSREKNNLSLIEGWFETDVLTKTSYAPLLGLLFPEIDAEGKWKIKGNFDPAYFVMSLEAEDATLRHCYGELSLPSFSARDVEWIYDIKEKKWQGRVDLKQAKLVSSACGLLLDALDATLHFDHKLFSIPRFSAHYQERVAEGSIEAFKLDCSLKQLTIEGANLHYTLQEGRDMHCIASELLLDYREQPIWHFHLKIQDDLQLLGYAKQEEKALWQIHLDPDQTRFANVPLYISRCQLKKEGLVSLEMKTRLTCAEFSSGVAFLEHLGLLSFPQLSLQEEKWEGALQLTLGLQDEEICFTAQGEEIVWQGQKITPFLLRGAKRAAHLDIEECLAGPLFFKAHGEMRSDLVELSDLEAEWDKMQMKGSGVIDCAAKSFSLSLDSVRGALSFSALQGNLAAHAVLKGVFFPLRFEGEATCSLDVCRPVQMVTYSNKPFKISYTEESGYTAQEISVFVKSKKEKSLSASFILPQAVLSRSLDDFKATSCQCTFYSPFVQELIQAELLPSFAREIEYNGAFEGAADVHICPAEISLRGRLKEGKYRIKGQELDLKQLCFQSQRGIVTLQAKTECGQHPLWGALSLSLSKDPQGILRFADDPKAEGVRAYFKTQGEKLEWEKILGTCCGVHCELNRNKDKKFSGGSLLSGRVTLDLSQLSSFLPQPLGEKLQKAKAGKGFSWTGDLVVWEDPKRGFALTGEILGEEWELLGYRFKQLRATLDAQRGRISLSNVHIDDDAGSLKIKNVELEKKEHWQLSIPLISIREWRPSLMRKQDASSSESKPFTIRHFIFSNIRADFGQPDSLEGFAKLSFVNQSKKESTLLDTPLEMIKNFGLDPGLLTPVQGEMEMDLRGDKLYLTAIKNTFSDGNRSEFYLAPGRGLSFIDLEGKMHIDLKMRQDVTLKLTEAFVLTIRGTLDNPRYGLQF